MSTREEEMEALLRSAHCIAVREGRDTHWQRFADSIKRLGIAPITARTYRILPTDITQDEQTAFAIKGEAAFGMGDLVKKKGTKGQWHGKIVGFYSASCTPIGYAVESLLEKGSVQIYPENALELWDGIS